MKGFDIDKIEEIDNGGKTQEQLLTGEYLTRVNPKSGMQPNAEVEGEEYVQFPDKETQRVEGPAHEQGGVPVVLPDETKILSKTLKLTKQQAKSLSNLFDVEVTEKDSYASALDKYTKKIGLAKLNQEQEEVFSTLKKQTENKNINSKTQKVNQDFLSKKIHGIEQRKEPLEKERAKMFDVLFEAQERTKAESGDQEAVFRYGGIQKSNFEATARKLGLDPTQAAMMLRSKREANLNIYEKGGQVSMYSGGGIFLGAGEQRLPTAADLSPEDQQKVIAYYKGFNKGFAAKLETNPELFKEIILNQALVNDIRTKGHGNINTGQQPTDRNTRLLPNAPTYGDLNQERLDNWALAPYYEAKTGKKFKDITSKEIGEMQKQYYDALKGFDEVEYFSGIAPGRVADNMMGNVTSSYYRKQVYLPAKESGVIDVDRLLSVSREEAQRELDKYDLKYEDLKPYMNAAVKYISVGPEAPANTPNPQTPATPPAETPPPTDPLATGEPIQDRVGQLPGREYPRLFFTPDQSVLPPTQMEAHLKANNRLQRIDPVRIGIEQTLQDTADQRNFVADQIQNLPESQRAAVLANLMATSQNTINKAATQANVVNAQNESQAELFNIQQAGQEGMMETNNALDFERRQFTAKGKADEQLRNYMDYNRKVNVTNFQNMQKLNLLDSLFPDFDLDFFGASVNYNPKSEWAPVVDNMPQQTSAQNLTPEEMRLKAEEARLKRAELAFAKERHKATQQGLFFNAYGNMIGWT
jgi:hypothetical protein